MASIDHVHNLAAARAPSMAAPTPPQGSNAAPNSQTPGHPSFRRCVAIYSPFPDAFLLRIIRSWSRYIELDARVATYNEALSPHTHKRELLLIRDSVFADNERREHARYVDIFLILLFYFPQIRSINQIRHYKSRWGRFVFMVWRGAGSLL